MKHSPIKAGPKNGPVPKVGLTEDRYYPGQEPQAVPWRGDTWVSYPLRNAADGGRSVKPGRGVGSRIERVKRPDEINRAPSNQRTYASWRSPSIHDGPTEATSGSPRPQVRREAPPRYGDNLKPPKKDATGHVGEQLKGTVRPNVGRVFMQPRKDYYER